MCCTSWRAMMRQPTRSSMTAFVLISDAQLQYRLVHKEDRSLSSGHSRHQTAVTVCMPSQDWSRSICFALWTWSGTCFMWLCVCIYVDQASCVNSPCPSCCSSCPQACWRGSWGFREEEAQESQEGQVTQEGQIPQEGEEGSSSCCWVERCCSVWCTRTVQDISWECWVVVTPYLFVENWGAWSSFLSWLGLFGHV